MTAEFQGRWYEKKLEVAAPIEAVWDAVSQGAELERWLCEHAEGGEGVGAEQAIDWGGGMVGKSKITAWDPPRHLRTEAIGYDPGAMAGGEPTNIPYAWDWFLEHEGGVTKVRLVASGFGEGPGWDGEYDGTYHGWDMLLANMRHYLEHHRGKPVSSLLFMAALDSDLPTAWGKLMGPEGLLKEGSTAGLEKGKRFRFVTSQGDVLEGTVTSFVDGRNLSAVVETLDQSLLNIEFCGMGDNQFLFFTIKTWGMDEGQTQGLRDRYGAIINTLFPQPAMPAGDCVLDGAAAA
ncbi:MAG TPA: SRPBCC domain-containing protein [bacterium]|nr:SRPBCC domain-containing protein [bacterium]